MASHERKFACNQTGVLTVVWNHIIWQQSHKRTSPFIARLK